jgi:hypothetical protein
MSGWLYYDFLMFFLLGLSFDYDYTLHGLFRLSKEVSDFVGNPYCYKWLFLIYPVFFDILDILEGDKLVSDKLLVEFCLYLFSFLRI